MKRSMPHMGTTLTTVLLACMAALWLVPAAGAATVGGGSVTLLTDPGQSKAMYLGGIAPFFVPPATLRLTTDAWRFSFPLAGGTVDTASGTGAVRAKGGIVFWGRETMSAWLQLEFTRLAFRTEPRAVVTGVAGTGGSRHVLATLDMSRAAVSTSTSGGSTWLTVAHVPAKLSPWLKAQLKAAFPRYAPSGSRLGTVTVRARLE
jgi:hypothetical protein